MKAPASKRVTAIAACVGICAAAGFGLVSARSFAEKSGDGNGAGNENVAQYIPSQGHAIDVGTGDVVDSVDDIPERYQTVANYVYDQLAYGMQPDATTVAPSEGVSHETVDDGDCTIDVIRYGTKLGDDDDEDDGTDGSADASDDDATNDAADGASDLGITSASTEGPEGDDGSVTWSVVRRKSDSRIVAIMAGDCNE